MILMGRTADYARINYNPDATTADITSIRSRIRQITSTGVEYEALDLLLRPVVKSNYGRDCKAFPEAPKITKQHHTLLRKLDPRTHRSVLLFHQTAHKLVKKSGAKREAVVQAFYQSVRERCKEVDPGSMLLMGWKEADLACGDDEDLKELVHEWSLHGTSTGLASKLRGCFGRSGLSSGEYEDQVERILYEFKLKNKAAVYGLKVEDAAGME